MMGTHENEKIEHKERVENYEVKWTRCGNELLRNQTKIKKKTKH